MILVKQKNSIRKIGIEVVVMKKLCKQEVIGMRIHQFKVSGLNNVHLICDFYFNFWFSFLNVKIGISYAIQTTYLELMYT